MSKISEIERYLEEKKQEYKKVKKYKFLTLMLCSILFVGIVFLKRPEPVKVEVIFMNANEEVKVSIPSNKVLKDTLEELELTSQNIYYLNDEIITFKELQKTRLKEKTVISYIVVSFDEETVTAVIDFETERKEDDTLSVGTERVQTEGKVGSKEIYTKVTLYDGVEVNKEITEKIIVSATKEVILVGTRELPTSNEGYSGGSSRENSSGGGSNSSGNSPSGNPSSGSTEENSGGDSDKEYEIEIR